MIHAGLVESVASVMPALTAEPERQLRKQSWAALADAAHDVPTGIEVTTTLRTGPTRRSSQSRPRASRRT